MEERKRYKIVIAEPEDFSQAAEKKLMEKGQIIKGPFTTEELKSVSRDCDAMVLRLGHYIDRDFFKDTDLKFILTPTTGLDHIDCAAAERNNTDIISLQGHAGFLENIPSTAEHTWALLLALLRKIPAAASHVLEGNWDRDRFKSRNLNALTLGILGFGRVGRQISKYAEAFNMDYYFYDLAKTKKNHPRAVSTVDDLLKKSDILSIHIPLNKENENFLDQRKLNKLKTGALIINTSRGELIDENALVNSLLEGKVAGLATDVLAGELYPEKRRNSPLLSYARQHNAVIITPHIAGATLDSMQITEEFVVDEFLQRLSKQ
ncbi:NAD(P)-dependent oxidoreductase [Flavimarina sp. Hel_I_48]|uniref:NAD(P)-dependent oxidoreductase n=1 Tax=Flavimarina sp. Hel_I_48 TaxID=1392488 RepID=UPI0004DECD61|nr:NAD(P)-dependent oxidoreductase [Flavimarina sp. Hel_I_48]